ncbi:m-AAA protease-interacting protein 1, mitochondrial-like [Spodoptera litura]|uniref:M-AAA protease-interacting protein 1, mitochondrial-like n=1 Tax=Spodoptera litura TaxID=69820 RepID=A0A9J7DSX5_SPOLT|nr:m-AAA protease-interacting protein 1, mitochondrial-like [Spodoptera litura]
MMASAIIILPRRMCPVATRVIATNFHSLYSFTKTIPALQNSRPNYTLTTNFYNQSLVEFRHLKPRRNDCGDDKLIQPAKSSSSFLKDFQKSFGFSKRNEDPKKNRKRRVPRLILLQNPFTWLMIKIDFSVLRNIWDPTFHEREFKFGTKQAISRVTQVISTGQLKELNGLLTKPARLSLVRELDRNWGEKQRSLLALKNDDIQISSPRKVYFIRIGDKKFCDVDMAFLALKWAPINSIEALIFTEIFARFHREYTPHCIPEWTIAYFKVTRFEVLRR